MIIMDDALFNEFSNSLKALLTPLNFSSTPRLIVALSGGLDSIVLLHLLYRFKSNYPDFDLLAHNVNHGLSSNADNWGDFCGNYCKALGVSFISTNVSIENKSRTSLEALARDARYQAFKNNMQANDIILTGHHQDDQLETLLLALKRGAGSTGLQGIKTIQTFAQGYLVRPLLIFSRQQLADYAELHKLQWIEDESNQNIDFDRNFIRQKISPLLKQRWPTMMKTASRTAQLCQEQQSLLNEIAEQDLTQCLSIRFANQTLDINKLSAFSDVRRNNIIRFWLKSNGLQYPSSKQLSVIWHEVALAQSDKQPIIQLSHESIRRYQGLLYIVREQPLTLPNAKVCWNGEELLWLVEGKLGVNFSKLDKAHAQQYQIECALRHHLEAGLVCLPENRAKARSVKKLLHEYHVPPWLRDQVVFVFVDKQLVEAIGLWKCHVPSMPTMNFSLDCQ